MAEYAIVKGQTVRIDLSKKTRPERDLIWLMLVSQYGNRQVTVINAGLAYEVELPPDTRSAHFQTIIEALIFPKHHCEA